MTTKYRKKKFSQHNILHTIITAILLCVVFLGMIVYLYDKAENEAYENLHIQTKQIKDNLVLQVKSDNENLVTMANFAAKLNASDLDYDIMFDSFKPIGLFSRIGILTPDCVFITKDEVIDLKDKISFEEEAALGEHFTGRTYSYSRPDEEVIRSAVPIMVNGETVGIIYGIIKTDEFEERYGKMADELDAQLFVYEKESGNMLIDTIQDELKNISFLQNRKFNAGTSYEQLISSDKGFASFESAYKNETLHLHYSTIEEFGWMIAVGRYDSQVFAGVNDMTRRLLLVILMIIGIIGLYIFLLMANERKLNAVTECASNVRKELLEMIDGQNNIQDALIEVCNFANSVSAVFFDTNGEFYYYTSPQHEEIIFSEKDGQYFRSELLDYASKLYKTDGKAVNILCIKPNKHLEKTNCTFHNFLQEHGIREISLAATTNKTNYVTILATINSRYSNRVKMLGEKISACFSMALHNKNYLNKTELAATTDSLTGVLNRVSYNRDLIEFDNERPRNFSCIYIDVNELHFRNNKFGHAAGDEMLLYIAVALKDIFCGHKVYRMGGDEFLVFIKNTEQEYVKNNIKLLIEQLKPMDYHIAIGVSYRTQNTNTVEMVKEAEIRMYEAKAHYYQNKEQKIDSKTEGYIHTKTGILEIDTILSLLKDHYNGIYHVSLDNDRAYRILMPAYLGYNEDEEHFSKLLSKYIYDTVSHDFHRALINFLNYDVLKAQLIEGKTPKITFKKTNGETVILSIYNIDDGEISTSNTLWVFSKA